MSGLGFRSTAFGVEGGAAGRRRITADSLYRGPPNPRLEQFMAQAQRQKEEADAAKAMRQDTMRQPTTTTSSYKPAYKAPPAQRPAQAQRPGARPQPGATVRPSTGVLSGGIESRIEEAQSMARDALARANSLFSEMDERLTVMEEGLVGLQNAVKELQDQQASVLEAARDAWMATFVMHGVVARPVAITDSLPPEGNIVGMLDTGDAVVCIGEMMGCGSGTAIAARTVHPETGQVMQGYVLLRDNDGTQYVNGFTL